jgi:hypothetical protein
MIFGRATNRWTRTGPSTHPGFVRNTLVTPLSCGFLVRDVHYHLQLSHVQLKFGDFAINPRGMYFGEETWCEEVLESYLAWMYSFRSKRGNSATLIHIGQKQEEAAPEWYFK